MIKREREATQSLRKRLSAQDRCIRCGSEGTLRLPPSGRHLQRTSPASWLPIAERDRRPGPAGGGGRDVVRRGIRGEFRRGAQGCAGDIGHIQIPADREVICRCGNVDCVEALAGGAALARISRLRRAREAVPSCALLLEEQGSLDADGCGTRRSPAALCSLA